SPANGIVLQCVWLDRPSAPVLLIAAHHLVVDGVTWRILVPDLITAWAQHSAGQPVALPEVGTSMRRWAHALADDAVAPERAAELPMWQRIVDGPDPLFGPRPLDPALDVHERVRRVTVGVDADVTAALLAKVPALFHGSVNDGL